MLAASECQQSELVAAACSEPAGCAIKPTSRDKQQQQRRASQRIKLSRELMVRLSAALDNHRRQAAAAQVRPYPHPHPDKDPHPHLIGLSRAELPPTRQGRASASSSPSATTTTTTTTTPTTTTTKPRSRRGAPVNSCSSGASCQLECLIAEHRSRGEPADINSNEQSERIAENGRACGNNHNYDNKGQLGLTGGHHKSFLELERLVGADWQQTNSRRLGRSASGSTQNSNSNSNTRGEQVKPQNKRSSACRQLRQPPRGFCSRQSAAGRHSRSTLSRKLASWLSSATTSSQSASCSKSRPSLCLSPRQNGLRAYRRHRRQVLAVALKRRQHFRCRVSGRLTLLGGCCCCFICCRLARAERPSKALSGAQKRSDWPPATCSSDDDPPDSNLPAGFKQVSGTGEWALRAPVKPSDTAAKLRVLWKAAGEARRNEPDASDKEENSKEKAHRTDEEIDKQSVIFEPPLKRIPRSPKSWLDDWAGGGQVSVVVSASSGHVLCFARERLAATVADTGSVVLEKINNNKTKKKKTNCNYEQALIGSTQNQLAGGTSGNGANTSRKRGKTRQCDTSPRRLPVWALLFGLLALVGHQVGGASGQTEADQAKAGRARPPASDEFRDTVLATMSTQSPPAGLEEPPVLGNGSFASGPAGSGPDLFEPPLDPGGANNSNDLLERLLAFCRIFVMGAIIVGDICGNSLVILSVCRHSKLRVTTNWFVVSLACADILVALFAMTFNASVIVSGRWLFKPWVCDFWNSCDVLASTASILHLCCISIDRYIAITRPLDYPMKITTRRVVYALCAVWISSALLSYIPIFTGVYTTAEHIKWLEENPDQCDFVVNRVYAVVSSSISFWIPSSIMVFTYYRIYKEATRQEKFIYKAQSMMPAPMSNHHHHSSNHQAKSKQRRSKSMAFSSSASGAPPSNEARIRQLARQQHELQRQPAKSAINNNSLLPVESQPAIATTELCEPAAATSGAAPVGERASSLMQLAERNNSGAELSSGGESEPLRAADLGAAGKALPKAPVPKTPSAAVAQAKKKRLGGKVAFDEEDLDDDDDEERDSNSGQSTPTKRSISKMKREHKAAKTLGIIMGVFILCWLPFFSWYTPQHICGHACDGIVPRGAVTILFWIGYFNSTLNPIIYAYFNHEFRDAFKKTLQWIFCCCNDLKCLRVNRPNDNQHYNCTYRSTQEIGLVSNS